MSVSNPYQPFFDKLDAVLADDGLPAEPRDLLQRAGFVLANLLNVNAQALPTLILPPETPTEAEGDPDSGAPGTT